jgi:hypothetical protein
MVEDSEDVAWVEETHRHVLSDEKRCYVVWTEDQQGMSYRKTYFDSA